MDRLFGHLFSNVVGYMTYSEETKYMMSKWGCKKTTPELCEQLRVYRQEILPHPRIEDMIRYYFHPCERSCPYYISYDDAAPLLLYSIREYGKIVTCKSLYAIALHVITEDRYPSEFELLLYEQLMRVPIVSIPHVDDEEQIHSSNSSIHRPNPIRFDRYKITKTIPDQVCCICQENIVQDQYVMTLPCLHTFHSKNQSGPSECLGIESWLERSSECPLCKKNILNPS